MADVLNSTLPLGHLPTAVGNMLVAAVQAASRASEVATGDTITTASIAYPVVNDNAGVVWLAEGDDFPADSPDLGDVHVTPAKVGGMTVVSMEAFDDSPTAPEAISNSLAASIAAKVDAAFVGAVAAPAPQGLGTISPGTTVPAGAATNLDFVVDAAAAIESAGGTATSLLVSPARAAHLAKLKTGTGSNAPLLAADPTQSTRRLAAGVPVVPVPALGDNVAYVLDGTAIRVVYRTNPRVDVSRDRYFDTGRIAIRAVARVGFGFLAPSRIAKVTFTA